MDWSSERHVVRQDARVGGHVLEGVLLLLQERQRHLRNMCTGLQPWVGPCKRIVQDILHLQHRSGVSVPCPSSALNETG